jgi:hypothetical protein
MVTRFFANNPILYKIRDGRPKSEDRCTGYFSLLVRIILNYHFTGIIAHIILLFLAILQFKVKVRKYPARYSYPTQHSVLYLSLKLHTSR